MPYPVSIDRQQMSFEIPRDDFLNLLNFEEANWLEFELPTLSTILDKIPGVSNTEYNGHFGSHVFATFDLDDDGEVPQLEEFQQRLDEHFADVRRVAHLMPALVASPRSLVHEYYQEDENGKRVLRTMLYSDDQFMIADSMIPHTIALFYKEDGVPKMKEMPRVAGILDMIDEDQRERSSNKLARNEMTLSRDISKVRARIGKHIQLADVPYPKPAALRAVDVSNHFLALDIPNAGKPLFAHRLFVVADSGPNTGLSVTFRADGEVGTKWFMDGARDQIIEGLQTDVPRLTRFILSGLPDDLEGPEGSSPRFSR